MKEKEVRYQVVHSHASTIHISFLHIKEGKGEEGKHYHWSRQVELATRAWESFLSDSIVHMHVGLDHCFSLKWYIFLHKASNNYGSPDPKMLQVGSSSFYICSTSYTFPHSITCSLGTSSGHLTPLNVNKDSHPYSSDSDA